MVDQVPELGSGRFAMVLHYLLEDSGGRLISSVSKGLVLPRSGLDNEIIVVSFENKDTGTK